MVLSPFGQFDLELTEITHAFTLTYRNCGEPRLLAFVLLHTLVDSRHFTAGVTDDSSSDSAVERMDTCFVSCWLGSRSRHSSCQSSSEGRVPGIALFNFGRAPNGALGHSHSKLAVPIVPAALVNSCWFAFHVDPSSRRVPRLSQSPAHRDESLLASRS